MRAVGAALRFCLLAAAVALALAVFGAGTEVSVPADAYVFAMGTLVVVRLLATAARWAPPGEPPGPPLLWRAPRPEATAPQPPGLAELEGMVAAALTSGRAARRRLLPRLAALADDLGAPGSVPLDAGDDDGVRPEAVAQVLARLERQVS